MTKDNTWPASAEPSIYRYLQQPIQFLTCLRSIVYQIANIEQKN